MCLKCYDSPLVRALASLSTWPHSACTANLIFMNVFVISDFVMYCYNDELHSRVNTNAKIHSRIVNSSVMRNLKLNVSRRTDGNVRGMLCLTLCYQIFESWNQSKRNLKKHFQRSTFEHRRGRAQPETHTQSRTVIISSYTHPHS